MTVNLGDLTEDATVMFKFPTRTSTGAAITLAGTPVLECYKDDNATQTATGLTLDEDFDTTTGFHQVKLDTSASAFYVTGSDYTIKLSAGTVDGVDVTHEPLAYFSIENRFSEPKPKINGSGFIQGDWIWSTATTGNPLTGRIRGDNATIASITELVVNEITDDGSNSSIILQSLRAGDQVAVYFQTAPTTNLLFEIDATPSEVSGIWTITGSVSSSSGSFVNTSVSVVFHKATLNANVESLLEALVMQKTTIATLSSQTSFTLTEGSADNDAYEAATIVVVDASTAEQKAFGSLSAYTGSSKTVTLAQDPGIFTMAVGDIVYILPSDVFAMADRVLNGSTHNIPGSWARRVRQQSASIIFDGIAQAGSTVNTIVLDSGASATDGAYDPAGISISAGTGAGQSRLIFQYEGATRTAVVDRNWKTIPDATSEFVITADSGREHVNEGQLQAATLTTATLNTLAAPANDTYLGQQIFIRSGTGDDQVRSVVSYNGTTKIAIVFPAWDTIPNATSGYAMLPIFRPSSTLLQGTAQGATSDTITLDATSSPNDDFFDHTNIEIAAGTGKGQERIVAGYKGATKIATITPAWTVTPDSSSQYEIHRGQTHSSTMNGGYLEGLVWVDTLTGTAGSLKYVNGTTTRPSDNLIDSFLINTALNLNGFKVEPGSVITLPSDSSNKLFTGSLYTLVLNGKNISNSQFEGAVVVTGIATATVLPVFRFSGLSTCTLSPFAADTCAFLDVVTLSSAGNTTIGNSSPLDIVLPQFLLPNSASASSISLQDWTGQVQVKNMGLGGGAAIVNVSGSAHLILDVSSTAGTVNVFAPATIDLNGATGITVNFFESGLDWNRVTNQSATVALLNTTIEDLSSGALAAKAMFEYDTAGSDGIAPKNSMYSLVHSVFHSNTQTAGFIRIFETDDATLHDTFTITIDANADHIVKVGS